MTSDKHMTRPSKLARSQSAAGGEGRSEAVRIDTLTSDEVERAAAEQLDEDGLGAGWATSITVVPARNKTAVSLRLDPDLIDWFRASGPGYQTRINDVLRAYVRHVTSPGEGTHTTR